MIVTFSIALAELDVLATVARPQAFTIQKRTPAWPHICAEFCSRPSKQFQTFWAQPAARLELQTTLEPKIFVLKAVAVCKKLRRSGKAFNSQTFENSTEHIHLVLVFILQPLF